MTTGQLIFYSGAALMVLTILLAIFFSVKKPEYHPETASFPNSGQTEPMHSGLTSPVTETGPAQATEKMAETAAGTELMQQTELMGGTAAGTKLMQQTELMDETAAGTELMQQAGNETELL